MIRICQEMGINLYRRQLNLEATPERQAALKQFLQQQNIGMLLSSDSNRPTLEALAPYRAFHVVRDLRDILASGYYAHLYSHPIRQ
jgi:hypothetical protein